MKIDDLDSRVSVNIELLIWDREHFFVLIFEVDCLIMWSVPTDVQKTFLQPGLGVNVSTYLATHHFKLSVTW